MKRLALMMVVVALALVAAVAVPAYGQSSAGDAYGGNGNGVLGAVGGGNGSPPAQVQSAGSGSLPFTGLDIGLLALGGCALVGVGVGLRRFARPLN